MERLIALVVLTAIAVAIAIALQRRRPDPPTAPSYRAPQQLDRSEFTRPDAPALLVVFGSTTCDTCPKVWSNVEELMGRLAGTPAEDGIAHQRVDVQEQPDLHRRYRIDGVPTTVLADADGVVASAWFGPVRTDELADALGMPPA